MKPSISPLTKHPFIAEYADDIKLELHLAATNAANDMLHRTGGDNGACGFAWVTIHPEHKGNTKAGKAERRAFEALGAKKDYTGKAWEIWKPGSVHVQSVLVLEAGAEAAAKVLKGFGLDAYGNSRLD